MIYIIIAIIVLLVIYVFITYNGLIKSKNYVKEAFSTMDVYLKKRWDLIPNIVEVVKGYAKYEQETLSKVTELRTSAYDGMTVDKKISINEQITTGISKIIAISENYPELKANESFIQLSNELTNVEKDIENSRKYYNGTVRNYNNKIQMFPSNIIASLFGFKEEKMFEANSEEKNNVKVDL